MLIEETAGHDALEEWFDHPVTKWFVQVVESRCEFAEEELSGSFYPGEPFKTQEVQSFLRGALAELTFIFDKLNEKPEQGKPYPLNDLYPYEVSDE